MIVILKKWNMWLLCGICVLALGTVGLAVRSGRAVPTAAIPTSGKRIVIDAGHGEPDGGATGVQGVKEQEINLAIAFKVQEFLEQSGAEVVVTRADENSIHDSGSTIRSKKISDMKNRRKIMNESNADVFVSIHMNQFDQTQYRGHQVFYSKNNEQSKQIAQLIQARLIEVLDPPEKREIKPASKDIYLLHNAEIPAVLIECGFLSNPEEEKLLLTEEYQKKLAWGIYTGLIQYFNQ